MARSKQFRPSKVMKNPANHGLGDIMGNKINCVK